MDRFSQIEQNNYSSFGGDMYGTNVKIPVHSYRSLYSKQPIYYTDYGSGGYPYPVYGRKGWRSQWYAKPPSGGIWAADGKSESIGEPAPPSGLSPSSKKISDDNFKILIGGVVGAIGGYFVAKAENQNLIAGVLIGGGAVAGAAMLLNQTEK